MNNQEAIKNLEKLKEYFNSPMFKNSESMIDTMDIAIRSLQREGELAQTEEELAKTEGYHETPFDRVSFDKAYYSINVANGVCKTIEKETRHDNALYECCNYFNDASFGEQIALHQLLYRKLLKFKLQDDTCDVNSESCFFIRTNSSNLPFVDVLLSSYKNFNGVYFSSRLVAERALFQVVIPFLEEHPDFIWNL